MKKTYVYFLIPIIALAVFSVVYWNFSTKYEKNQADMAAKARQQKEADIERENADKKKAYDEAVAAADLRKKQKEAKEKQDAADAEARQQASDERYAAQQNARSLATKEDRLLKDVESAKKEVASIQADKAAAQKDEAFLRTYVKQAQDNAKELEDVLTKIKEADDAAARAAAEAAAAAKAKK